MKNSVLLIENDQSIAEIIDYILTDAGYQVIQATTPHNVEAIKSLRPGVVLLDYSLNGHITGDSICSELKADPETAGIPVIIVSAMTGIEAMARSCKADDVLPKPFDISDLENLVSKWFNTNRLAC